MKTITTWIHSEPIIAPSLGVIRTLVHLSGGNGKAEFAKFCAIAKIPRDISKEISQVDHDEGMKRLDVFKRWFLETVMEQGRKNTIVVIPIEDMAPRYRDRATTNFNPVGVPMLFLSPIIGGPELTIPIGTVSFESEVTKRTEHMPVAVSLLTEPNADLLLIDWATKMLQGSGRPTEVSVGQHLFEGDAEEGLAAFCARE